MLKIQIAAEGADHGPGHDPRIDHLRPVIEYLLAQGNRPAQWWHEDGWRSDRAGELHYLFTDPINAAQLREHFAFPDSIRLDDAGTIRDGMNRVTIAYDRPTPPMSFELVSASTPLAVDTPLNTDLPALDDGQAAERLRQIIEAHNARRDADPA